MSDSYIVKRSSETVQLDAPWDSALWSQANTADILNGFERNGDFKPEVKVKMLYDDKRICGLFQVHDRYVLAHAKADQDMVCRDSCVEFFTKPQGAERYFNFEMNCGGIVLLYHIKQLRPTKDYELVPQEDMNTIERYHSLPQNIEEEITEPVTWNLGFAVPIAFFEKYSKINPELSGQIWTANFTKCADKSSHPCWLSWQPLSECNFHMPDQFGKLIFD